jgi:hypothetical protein
MSATPSLADAPAVPPAEAGTCGVCPHALADHDRISLRFCQATRTRGTGGATARGCVCPS